MNRVAKGEMRGPPPAFQATFPKVRNNWMVEKIILKVGFGGASSVHRIRYAILREEKNWLLREGYVCCSGLWLCSDILQANEASVIGRRSAK